MQRSGNGDMNNRWTHPEGRSNIEIRVIVRDFGYSNYIWIIQWFRMIPEIYCNTKGITPVLMWHTPGVLAYNDILCVVQLPEFITTIVSRSQVESVVTIWYAILAHVLAWVWRACQSNISEYPVTMIFQLHHVRVSLSAWPVKIPCQCNLITGKLYWIGILYS